MAEDESRILFPVDQLKAETLRTIAKDLGVAAGGKKEDLLKRFRTRSDSGWTSTTPSKRRIHTVKTPDATRAKKLRTPKTVTAVPLSRTRSGRTMLDSPARKRKPKDSNVKKEDIPKGAAGSGIQDQDVPSVNEVEGSSTAKRHIFDDYMSSGSTNIFITADDLFTIVEGLPSSAALPLWKATSSLAQRDQAPQERVHLWFIPVHEENKIQNVSSFREGYKDLLEIEREKRLQLKEKKSENHDEKDGAASVELSGVKTQWYQLDVSRDMGKSALAVKLVKGSVEDKKTKDAEEEHGSFWLNNPKYATQDETEALDHVRKLITV